MEENDKENLLIPELDEDSPSQSEEANEEKRDDKVDFDISYVRELEMNYYLVARSFAWRQTKTWGASRQEN